MNYDMALSLEFIKAHPLDAARVLEQIPIQDAASYIENVPADIAANMVRMMDSLTMIKCFGLMKPDAIGAIAEKLPLEISSMILRKMDKRIKDTVMKTFQPETLESLHLKLRFPEDTAAAFMDPRYFVLTQDLHARDAIRRVRSHLKQNTSYLYVVTRDHILVGFINMYEMLHMDPKAPISSKIQTDIWKLSAHSNRQAILMNPGWKKFHTLPVVDEKGVFLGAIDYQTIRRLEQEDIQAPQQNPLNETTAAMGELFWVGLSGLVKGAASALSRSL